MFAADRKVVELATYCNKEEVRTARHNQKKTRSGKKRDAAGFNFYRNGLRHIVGGLTTFLKKSFYSHIKVSKRQYSSGTSYVKQGSSRALGNRVDRELFDYCKNGNKLKKNAHALTHAIVRCLKAHGYTVVAAQLPVISQATSHKLIMTQADLIVQTVEGRLGMLEVKTGAVAVNVAKGTFKAPYDKVPFTKRASWDMQRHFTHRALCDAGLPLAFSKVIHAYQERHGNVLTCHVKEYPAGDWMW